MATGLEYIQKDKHICACPFLLPELLFKFIFSTCPQ